MPNWGGGASGAASGAGLGFQFGGPVGAAIGGTGGFLAGLFTGGKKKKKPGDEGLGEEEEVRNLLRQRSEQLSGEGARLRETGEVALSPVLQYFKQLMSGDPAAMLEATRPERGRVIDQYDTARRAISEFAPRGGGAAQAVAGSYVQQGQQLADITSQARQGAVAGLAQLGPQLQALGLNAEQVASMDLNTLINAITQGEYLGLQRRGQNIGAATGVGEAIGSLLGLYLTREGGAWGAKPKAA